MHLPTPILAEGFSFIWLIGLVLWGLYNLLLKGKVEKADPEAEAAAARRAREIQEEIRRRIAERQAAEQGGQPQRPGTDIQDEIRRRIAERQAGGAQQPAPPPIPHRAPQPQYQQPAQRPQGTQGPARTRIEEMIRRVEEARRQQEEAQRRATQMARESEDDPHIAPDVHTRAHLKAPITVVKSRANPLSNDVRSSLADATKLRSAIVLAEILGPPIAERRDTRW